MTWYKFKEVLEFEAKNHNEFFSIRLNKIQVGHECIIIGDPLSTESWLPMRRNSTDPLSHPKPEENMVQITIMIHNPIVR